MNKAQTQHNWTAFLTMFSQQNRNRPTRLGVFEGEPPVMTDYWLEDGLPLEDIDVDTRGTTAPTIQIMFGGVEKTDSRSLIHTIAKTRFVRIVLSASGEADGLDIENEDGSTTVLRFENRN